MARGVRSVALALLVSIAAIPSLFRPTAVPVVRAESPTTVYPLPARTPRAQVDGNLELIVLNLVNEERVAAGLIPLMPHATIQSAARNHGRELFAWGYLSHRSRDGRMPHDRILGLGVHVRLIGENLAYAADARTAHRALMASPSHRQNVLFPAYRLVGIGVVDGGEDGVIIVEDFTDDGIFYHLPRWWEKPLASRR